MTIEEIRRNAPDRASHYDGELNYYYKDGWFLYVWRNNDWSIFDMYPDVSKLKPLN